MNIAALIHLLEEAPGPDRALDGMIWAEIDGRDIRWGKSYFGNVSLLAKNRRPPHDECVIGARDEAPKMDGRFLTVPGHKPPVPYFTTSIDDAMALVPDACGWERKNGRMWVGRHSAIGKPAIALCIAALKARAA